MVNTCPLISKSSSLFTNPSGIYYNFTHLRVFHTSVSWWFFTGVWITAYLLKSPGLFLVFWPIWTMLLFACFPLVLFFQVLQSLNKSFDVYAERSNYTFMFHSFFHSLARFRYLSLFSLSLCFTQWTAKSTVREVLFFFLLLLLTITGSIGPVVRVFANGQANRGSIPGRVIPNTQKMILDASLLNPQHYKIWIKDKLEQSRKGVAPFPTPRCSSYWKGSRRVSLDYGHELYLLYHWVWSFGRD